MFSRISTIFIVSIMLIVIGGVQQVTADTEANKAIARRAFEEVLNQKKLDLIDEIYTTDYVQHPSEMRGSDVLKQYYAALFTAFPDGQWTVEDIFAEGDKVATRLTITGTQQGEFRGMPPTGKQVTLTMIAIYRFADGKLVEGWNNSDQLGLLEQLGVAPPTHEDFTWGVPSEVTGDPGDPEENKAILRRIVEEVINQKNLDLVDEFYPTDYVYHFPPNPDIQGPEGFKQYFSTAFAAFPDFHVTIEDMFAERDRVVSRITARGTHQGEFMSIPPTGKLVTVTGIAIHRFADGKIVEDWEIVDFLGMMKQLTPPPVDTEANKALVRRFLEEAFSQGNLDVLDEIIAPDYVHYMAGVADVEGPEGNKRMISTLRADFPDLHWTIEDMFAEGDKVVTRATLHLGPHPTGVEVTTTAICTMHIADGKLAEGRTSPDQLGTMQQLGVITPGRPSPENYMWSAPSEVTGDPGTPEENKAIALRAAEELWNQHNVDLVDEFFAADFISHNPVLSAVYPEVGTESMKQAITDHFTALPDFHVTVHETLAEGDKLAQRWTVTGTHKGELMGIPPSGNQVTFTGFTINRFADGKIVEQWWAYDALGMMQQLTAPPEKDYSNVFFMPLAPGLNMISLPLEPQTPYTARSFADEIGATVVIKLDEARQRFVGFTLDAPDDGFDIEGGKGYIVNVPESRVVAFTGAAWTNQPPVEAAPEVRDFGYPTQSDGAWAFVVSRRLQDDSNDNLKKDGYFVTVRNTRTNAVATDSVRSGYFAAAFADLNRQNVVQTGDRLEVVVRNTAGEMVSDTLSYTVTADAILKAYLPLTLKNVYIPLKSLLLQNYPNPFNPETWIPYQIRQPAEVMIRIYNANGRLVRTLALGQRQAGFYLGRSRAASWDGHNDAGEKVSSGVYFYQIQAGDFNATRKLVIVK